MTLSPIERIGLVLAAIALGYRLLAGEWPVGIEIEAADLEEGDASV